MQKKFFVLVAVLMVCMATGAFGFGLGLQFNGNAGRVFEPGVAVTFKAETIPLYFAVNWYIADDTAIGLTGDYWVINNKLANLGSQTLNWFIGIGFFANTVFADEFEFSGGLRVPIGLNMYLADGFFEPFVQVAPSFGLEFVPSLGTTTPFFPISAGFRIWFK